MYYCAHVLLPKATNNVNGSNDVNLVFSLKRSTPPLSVPIAPAAKTMIITHLIGLKRRTRGRARPGSSSILFPKRLLLPAQRAPAELRQNTNNPIPDDVIHQDLVSAGIFGSLVDWEEMYWITF